MRQPAFNARAFASQNGSLTHRHLSDPWIIQGSNMLRGAVAATRRIIRREFKGSHRNVPSTFPAAGTNAGYTTGAAGRMPPGPSRTPHKSRHRNNVSIWFTWEAAGDAGLQDMAYVMNAPRLPGHSKALGVGNRYAGGEQTVRNSNPGLWHPNPHRACGHHRR